MNEVTTYRWSFEEDVQHYAAAGYRGIGVWRQKLSDYGEARGIELLADSQLEVTNLLWAGGFTGSNGLTLEESIEDASHAIALAGAMQARCLVVYPGGRNNHTFRHAERLLSTALSQLLAFAEAADVVLALEPMHPACAKEWTFLTDLHATIALLESFGSDHLKLVFDTYHFGHDASVLANLTEIVSHIALVQLSDRLVKHTIDQDRCTLGDGILPLEELVQSLFQAGYTGGFDVELFGQDIELCDYHHLLDASKAQFEELVLPKLAL